MAFGIKKSEPESKVCPALNMEERIVGQACPRQRMLSCWYIVIYSWYIIFSRHKTNLKYLHEAAIIVQRMHGDAVAMIVCVIQQNRANSWRLTLFASSKCFNKNSRKWWCRNGWTMKRESLSERHSEKKWRRTEFSVEYKLPRFVSCLLIIVYLWRFI